MAALVDFDLQELLKANTFFKLKSLIMAQIERWRHALDMQVERESTSV